MEAVEDTLVEFPFPFKPYDIQRKFMRCMYRVLEEGKIGMFESPTGTGKSLSIICSCLKWLEDHQEEENRKTETIMSGNVSVLVTAESDSTDKSSIPDWFSEYDQQKILKEKIFKITEASKRRQRRQERIKQLKEQYGTSLIKTKDTKTKESLEELQYQFENPESIGDSDIVLHEYHSDEDSTKKYLDSSDDSDNDFESDDDTVKIFYASRTHSQLTQFVHEIQKTQYKDSVSVISLGSRQTYCLNKSVSQLRSISLINDRCLELQKNRKKVTASGDDCHKKKKQKTVDSKGCPYYKPVAMETLRDLSLGEIHDIEQLTAVGRQLTACPYYASRYAVPIAQLIVLPYNSLLHAPTRDALGINLTGHIVIIDEAHNIIDTISSIYSVVITLGHIKKTYSQLTRYKDRYHTRLKAKNLVYIDQLLYILTSFQGILCKLQTGPVTDHGEDANSSELMRLNEFLLQAKVDNINMFKILNYCRKSEISKKLNGFADRYMNEDTSHEEQKSVTTHSVKSDVLMSDTHVPKSPFVILEQFIESLTSVDKDCRIVITRSKFDSYSKLKYLLLNPSVHFTSVVKEARSVVLAGGTMQPFSEYKNHLFIAAGIPESCFVEFSCGHVIDRDHLLPIVLSNGSSGLQFNFNYHNRQNIQMIEELGRSIANLCSIVPGGVVCFFSSYEYEQTVYANWEKSGLLDKIRKRKQILREPKFASQVELVLSQYTRCIEFSTSTVSGINGALLFCIVGGKLSEGINFSDDLGRCVIMIGLPYPNKTSPELIEKMEYLNATMGKDRFGRLAGQVHYENLCMKAVNQSIGRAIRHINDYAVIVLVDHRYSSAAIYNKLPEWISSQLLISSTFGQAFGAIRKVTSVYLPNSCI